MIPNTNYNLFNGTSVTLALAGDFVGAAYIPPVILKGWAKIKTKGMLDFELVNWSGSIPLTQRVNIYPR